MSIYLTDTKIKDYHQKVIQICAYSITVDHCFIIGRFAVNQFSTGSDPSGPSVDAKYQPKFPDRDEGGGSNDWI